MIEGPRRLESKESTEESDEQMRRLAVESLIISTEVFEDSKVAVYSGQSSQAYTILATGILEGRRMGFEPETVKNMAVRALKIAGGSFEPTEVIASESESSLAHAHLAKSILEQLLSDYKKHSEPS